MKGRRAGQVAVAALFLLLGGAVGVRLIRSSPPGPGASPTDRPAAPATLSGGTFRAAPETPAANLAIKLTEMTAEELRRPPAPGDELAKSRARDAEALGRDLKELLAREPALWRSVFEVMDTGSLPVSRRIAPMIREAVDEPTERELIEKLHGASRQDTRRLALDLLCGRTSGSSLSAVTETVRRDPDPGVRYAALLELAKRKDGATSPDAVAQIDQALRERAQVDASLEVRQAALRITGQLAETAPKSSSRNLGLRRPGSPESKAPPGK